MSGDDLVYRCSTDTCLELTSMGGQRLGHSNRFLAIRVGSAVATALGQVEFLLHCPEDHSPNLPIALWAGLLFRESAVCADV